MSTEGWRLLLDALKLNCKLREIRIIGDGFTSSELDLFNKAIEHNTTLRKFELIGGAGEYQEAINVLLSDESRLKRKAQMIAVTKEIQHLYVKVAQLELQNQETQKRLEFAEVVMLRVMTIEERSAWFADKLGIQSVAEAEQLSTKLLELEHEKHMDDSIRAAFNVHKEIEKLASAMIRNRKAAVSHFFDQKTEEYNACICELKLRETELTEKCSIDHKVTFQTALDALRRRKTILDQLRSLWLTIPGVDTSTSPQDAPSNLDASKKHQDFREWIELFKTAVNKGTMDSLVKLKKGGEIIRELVKTVGQILRERELECAKMVTQLDNAMHSYQNAIQELQYTTNQRVVCLSFTEQLSNADQELLECDRRCRRARHDVEEAEEEGLQNINEKKNQLVKAIEIRAQCRRRTNESKNWIRKMALSTLPELLAHDKKLGLEILNIGRDEDLELIESLDEYRIDEKPTPNVTKRTRLGTNETFVFKQLVITEKSATRINNEIRLLKKLKHENVGELSNVIRSGSDIYLKMPDYSEGSLEKWLSQSPPPLDYQKRAVFHRILKGLAYIHSHNIVHLDIKPSNVVLQRYGWQLNPRIIDFGISKDLSSTRTITTTTLGGTEGYEAPEVVERRQRSRQRLLNNNNSSSALNRVGVEADLWSVGVMLWEAFLETPLQLNNGSVVIPLGCPLHLQPLLKKLLQRDPRARGSAEYCLINFDTFWNSSDRNQKQAGTHNFQFAIAEIREAINRRLTDKAFPITLSRDNVLEGALILFGTSCDQQSVWYSSVVNFDGEGAIDAGGPRREFYSLFFSKVADRFFAGDEGSLLPLTNDKTTAERDTYRCIGKIMAKAIVDGAIAGVNFAKPLFKFLLADPDSTIDWTIDDLNEYSPKTARNLLLIEHATKEELDWYGLDEVTPSNRCQFITNKCLELVNTRSVALLALKSGFDLLLSSLKQDLADKNKQRILTTEVLHALLVGNLQMDYETVIPCLRFDHSWNPSSPTPGLLRDWIRTLTPDQRKQFWCFCTGTTALTATGGSYVTISKRHDGNLDALPESHTCSFNLVIPEYTNATTLATKMQPTLLNTIGFAFA